MVKKIDGWYVSEYGTTLERQCRYCTKILYQIGYKPKGRNQDNTLVQRKISFSDKNIWCNRECMQLDIDEQTVQTRKKVKEKLREDYKKKKVEKQLLKQNKSDVK